MEKQGTMVDLDLIFDFEMVKFLNNHILYKTWIQNIAKFQNIQLRIQNGQWHWLCSISKIRRIQNRPLHFEMHNLGPVCLVFSRTVFCSWKQKTPKTCLVERVIFVFVVPRVLKMALFREQQNVVFPVFVLFIEQN